MSETDDQTYGDLGYNDRNAHGLSELLREVLPKEETVFEVAREMIGDGDAAVPATTIKVMRRELQPEKPFAPDRRESPRRAHTCHEATGFAGYCLKHGTGKSVVVMADMITCEMKAVLDEKADGGFEVIGLKPAMHPLFKPWSEILDRTLPVKKFAEFIMANRRVIKGENVRELAMVFRQVHASIETELSQGVGNNSLNGLTIRTKIQAAGKSEHVDVPDTITVEVPLFIGTPAETIEIDLLAMADEQNGVTITASASMVLEAQSAAFTKMV